MYNRYNTSITCDNVAFIENFYYSLEGMMAEYEHFDNHMQDPQELPDGRSLDPAEILKELTQEKRIEDDLALLGNTPTLDRMAYQCYVKELSEDFKLMTPEEVEAVSGLDACGIKDHNRIDDPRVTRVLLLAEKRPSVVRMRFDYRAEQTQESFRIYDAPGGESYLAVCIVTDTRYGDIYCKVVEWGDKPFFDSTCDSEDEKQSGIRSETHARKELGFAFLAGALLSAVCLLTAFDLAGAEKDNASQPQDGAVDSSVNVQQDTANDDSEYQMMEPKVDSPPIREASTPGPAASIYEIEVVTEDGKLVAVSADMNATGVDFGAISTQVQPMGLPDGQHVCLMKEGTVFNCHQE